MSDKRVLAGLVDIHAGNIPRDEYAADLVKELDATDRQGTLTIKEADGHVIAALLDELAAVYRREPLGQLARELAVRLYDRMGI